MTEWFYKATPKKVTFEATQKLALDDSFLCRSAHTLNGPRVGNTMAVEFGDIIHFYFSQPGHGVIDIGSFEVVSPEKHPHPEWFGAMVPKTRLFQIDDEGFEQRLQDLPGKEGYRPDPVLKKLTGWILKRRDDVPTPEYDGRLFPPKTSFVRAPLSLHPPVPWPKTSNTP